MFSEISYFECQLKVTYAVRLIFCLLDKEHYMVPFIKLKKGTFPVLHITLARAASSLYLRLAISHLLSLLNVSPDILHPRCTHTRYYMKNIQTMRQI